MKVKIVSRNNVLYLRYQNGARDVRKSTKLSDTKQNRQYLQNEVIPVILIKLKNRTLQKAKSVRYYADKHLLHSEGRKSYYNIARYTEFTIKFFGEDRDVASITRLDIRDFVQSLKMKDVSKKNYLAALSGILQMAVEDEYIEQNKALNFPLKDDGNDVNPFTQEEVDKILSHASGSFKNILGVLFTMGMRPSELLGLKLPQISHNFIEINEVIVRGVTGKPKTKASKRKIPVRQEARQYFNALVNTSGRKTLHLVINENGEPYHDINALRKKWCRLLKECGIKHRKLYATRHTFISHMLLNGVSAPIIAEFVGHEDVRVIQQTYGKYIEGSLVKIDDGQYLYSGTISGTLDKIKVSKS
ncbi:MAG: site-specific integrase [Campylobacteraceae bacterium]|nr:site-specific integrase [Campylobacteraceae bacterium]